MIVATPSGAERMKRFRSRAGWTQRLLAHHLGVSERQVRRWEGEEQRTPRAVELAIIHLDHVTPSHRHYTGDTP